MDGPNTKRAFGSRGAAVVLNNFDLGTPPRFLTSDGGLAPTDTHRIPPIWMAGFRLGQHTLIGDQGHVVTYLRQGRETLVTVDLATSWRRLNGVKVYANFDGYRVDAQQDGIVCRDWLVAAGTSEAFAQGKSTFNILLPPTQKAQVPLLIRLDTTGVQGFAEAGNLTVIYSETLNFDPPPGILRIGVVPVQVNLPGYPTGEPKAQPVIEVLRTLLPAMWPLRADEIEVVEEPLVVYGRSAAGWLDQYSVYSLHRSLAAYLEIYVREHNFRAALGEEYERVVGVLLPLDRGKSDGENVFQTPLVVLVDGSSATAVIRGLALSVGIATSQQQIPQFELEKVSRLENATAFVPEANLNLVRLSRPSP